MRILASAFCLLFIMAMAGCNKDEQSIIVTEKTTVVSKKTVSQSTFNIPGDITTITIN